jgi:hypothetical protein
MRLRYLLVGLLLLGASATSRAGNTLQVQVFDSANRPVAGASVCAGTEARRAERGSAVTNASGIAVLTLAAASAAASNAGGSGPVSGLTGAGTPVQVTASRNGRGAARVLPGAPGGGGAALVTALLTLPDAAGGPQCPAPTAAPVPNVGGIALDSAAIRARAAELADQPRPVVGVRLDQPEFCFGAAGQGCGDSFMKLSTCVGDACQINAGSWRHDECCVRNRNGGMCDNRLEELVTAQPVAGSPGQVCMVDFNKALRRLGTPLTWTRNVDRERANSTGIVNHPEYCAPRGTLMVEGEQAMCCSRAAQALGPIDAAAAAVALATVEPNARFVRCQ